VLIFLYFFIYLFINISSSASITWEEADTRVHARLKWYSAKSFFHFFDREYNHEVYLSVDEINWGKMVYQTKDWKVHCHPVNDWCVIHGDNSPEMSIWFNGNYYNHSAPTTECQSDIPLLDTCRQYDTYIEIPEDSGA
jgi:hypothetical protein